MGTVSSSVMAGGLGFFIGIKEPEDLGGCG